MKITRRNQGIEPVGEKLEVFGEPSMLTTMNVSKLSETELKTWIALLYNARNSLKEQKTHSCGLNTLMERSGYSRKSLKRSNEVLGIASSLVGSVVRTHSKL